MDSFRLTSSVGEFLNSRAMSLVRAHCVVNGLRVEDFLSDVGWSFWEYLEGVNATVVADSAVGGRLHLFLKGSGVSKNGGGYVMFDRGRGSVLESEGIVDEIRRQVGALVDFYENVRKVDCFDPEHCPIVELQIDVQGQIWFLQYHRGVQQKFVEWSLDRGLEGGEFEVPFVRGCTDPEGVEVDVLWRYSQRNRGDWSRLDDVKGIQANPVSVVAASVTERCIRSASLGVIASNRQFNIDQMRYFGSHGFISALFKPYLSVIVESRCLPQVGDDIQGKVFRGDAEMLYLPVRVVSDGHKAYMKVLGNYVLK